MTDISKQVEYEKYWSKSINMSDIMVYLAMFSTIIDSLYFCRVLIG